MSDAEILKTWEGLNAYLKTAAISDCERLIQSEMKGKHRLSFMRRIHSRLNKVRADSERSILASGGWNGEVENPETSNN